MGGHFVRRAPPEMPCVLPRATLREKLNTKKPLPAVILRAMNQASIKTVIVGAGGWGRQHARALLAHPDIDLRAVMARTPEKAAARAAEFHIKPYSSLPEMLTNERPDLVALCLPNQEHFAPTMEVIQAGIPLLVEKPLVFDLGEADALLRAAAAKNLFFAINFNHRYGRPAQMARAAIAAGELGEIVHATWRFGGEANVSSHPHANLIETQCHGFDQLEFLCGPIASVMAEMTRQTGGGFRTVALSVRFASGAVGNMLGTYDSSYAYRDAHRLEIGGTRGQIIIEDTVRRYTLQRAGRETAEIWEAGYFNDNARAFQHTFDAYLLAMIEAFKNKKQPPVHARAGRRALALAWAAVESFTTGKRIDVPVDPVSDAAPDM